MFLTYKLLLHKNLDIFSQERLFNFHKLWKIYHLAIALGLGIKFGNRDISSLYNSLRGLRSTVQFRINSSCCAMTTSGLQLGRTLSMLLQVTKELPVNDTSPDPGYYNAFHIAIGQNNEQYGDRIPAVYVNRDKFIHISSGVSNNTNYYQNYYNYTLNQWYHIERSIFQTFWTNIVVPNFCLLS